MYGYFFLPYVDIHFSIVTNIYIGEQFRRNKMIIEVRNKTQLKKTIERLKKLGFSSFCYRPTAKWESNTPGYMIFCLG